MTNKEIIVQAARSVAKNTMKKAPDIPVAAANEAFSSLLSAYKDCKIITEQEKTKRESIKAYKDVNIKAIEETSEILRQYLKQSFSEREKIIQNMFDRLDEGIKLGDANVIAQTIGAIVDVAKQSPLEAARNLIESYHNPDIKHIEI